MTVCDFGRLQEVADWQSAGQTIRKKNKVYRFYAGHCALLRQARRVHGCEQFKRMTVYFSLTDKEILRVIALGKTTVHHT